MYVIIGHKRVIWERGSGMDIPKEWKFYKNDGWFCSFVCRSMFLRKGRESVPDALDFGSK